MSSLSEMKVAELAAQCSEEMAKSRRQQPADDRYCFELFCRAIVQQDPAAWTALFQQYAPLVQSWMSLPAQDAEPLVNEVFARFWRRMTPELFQERFRHLGSVLAYLRVCARNLAINHVRRQERERQIAALLENVTVDLPESTAIRNVNVQELAACVRDCLSDDAERLVVFLSFEQGLKPREIHARYPDRFASPHEVSRIKERVLERLRHNLRLRGFWDAL